MCAILKHVLYLYYDGFSLLYHILIITPHIQLSCIYTCMLVHCMRTDKKLSFSHAHVVNVRFFCIVNEPTFTIQKTSHLTPHLQIHSLVNTLKATCLSLHALVYYPYQTLHSVADRWNLCSRKG